MQPPYIGKDLRSATRIIAYTDIVWTSIFIAASIVSLIMTASSFIVRPEPSMYLQNSNVSKTESGSEDTSTKIALGGLIVGTIILVVKILQLLLALSLLEGVKERNPHKCKIWVYITCVFVVITVMNFLFDVISVEGSKTLGYSSVIGIGLHVYFLWVVSAFKQELERSHAQPEADTGLKA